MNPESAPPQPTRTRFWAILRLLLIIVVLAAVVAFIFPLIFKPRIDVPTNLQYVTPSSMEFRLSNQNLTPLSDVVYICELSKMTLANGSAVENAKVLMRGSIRRIPGRRAIAGRCEASVIVTEPIKSAEYKLTVTYKTYPWPQQRSTEYRIGAQVSNKGEVTGWKLE